MLFVTVGLLPWDISKKVLLAYKNVRMKMASDKSPPVSVLTLDYPSMVNEGTSLAKLS